MGRRQFLAGVSKTAVALAMASRVKAAFEEGSISSQSVHLALMSDTHTPADPTTENRKFRPWENLKTVAAQINEARPEAVILNGDAARLTGELDDYAALKQLLGPLAAQAPVYIGMGNHDKRENFLKTFKDSAVANQKVAGKWVLLLERPALRLILLDSLLYSNQVAGLLGKAQRQWLEKFLADSDARPTVLFVHHTLGDGDGDLLDVERLFRLLAPHKKVKAIFYGHSHEFSIRQNEGLHLINIPAVGYNFTDREPVGWIDARFSAKGVELVLKAIGGNREKHNERTSLTWQ